MAFQVGSQVDPRLLDYSGYAQGMTNAALINAQSLADLCIHPLANEFFNKMFI